MKESSGDEMGWGKKGARNGKVETTSANNKNVGAFANLKISYNTRHRDLLIVGDLVCQQKLVSWWNFH